MALERHEELKWHTSRFTGEFWDFITPGPGPNHNLTDQTLVEILRGTGHNNRVGRHIHVKGLEIRGSISLPAIAPVGSDPTWDRVRVIVVEDHQKNGTTTATDLLMWALPGQAASDIPTNAFYNPDGFDRFTVWLDKTFSLQYVASYATGAVAGVVTHITENFEHSAKITYSGDNTIPPDDRWSNISQNNLQLFIFSETKLASFDLFFRIYFGDK